jgi:hypothetical protein
MQEREEAFVKKWATKIVQEKDEYWTRDDPWNMLELELMGDLIGVGDAEAGKQATHWLRKLEQINEEQDEKEADKLRHEHFETGQQWMIATFFNLASRPEFQPKKPENPHEFVDAYTEFITDHLTMEDLVPELMEVPVTTLQDVVDWLRLEASKSAKRSWFEAAEESISAEQFATPVMATADSTKGSKKKKKTKTESKEPEQKILPKGPKGRVSALKVVLNLVARSTTQTVANVANVGAWLKVGGLFFMTALENAVQYVKVNPDFVKTAVGTGTVGTVVGSIVHGGIMGATRTVSNVSAVTANTIWTVGRLPELLRQLAFSPFTKQFGMTEVKTVFDSQSKDIMNVLANTNPFAPVMTIPAPGAKEKAEIVMVKVVPPIGDQTERALTCSRSDRNTDPRARAYCHDVPTMLEGAGLFAFLFKHAATATRVLDELSRTLIFIATRRLQKALPSMNAGSYYRFFSTAGTAALPFLLWGIAKAPLFLVPYFAYGASGSVLGTVLEIVYSIFWENPWLFLTAFGVHALDTYVQRQAIGACLGLNMAETTKALLEGDMTPAQRMRIWAADLEPKSWSELIRAPIKAGYREMLYVAIGVNQLCSSVRSARQLLTYYPDDWKKQVGKQAATMQNFGWQTSLSWLIFSLGSRVMAAGDTLIDTLNPFSAIAAIVERGYFPEDKIEFTRIVRSRTDTGQEEVTKEDGVMTLSSAMELNEILIPCALESIAVAVDLMSALNASTEIVKMAYPELFEVASGKAKPASFRDARFYAGYMDQLSDLLGKVIGSRVGGAFHLAYEDVQKIRHDMPPSVIREEVRIVELKQTEEQRRTSETAHAWANRASLYVFQPKSKNPTGIRPVCLDVVDELLKTEEPHQRRRTRHDNVLFQQVEDAALKPIAPTTRGRVTNTGISRSTVSVQNQRSNVPRLPVREAKSSQDLGEQHRRSSRLKPSDAPASTVPVNPALQSRRTEVFRPARPQ